jgi:hypothetical protein
MKGERSQDLLIHSASRYPTLRNRQASRIKQLSLAPSVRSWALVQVDGGEIISADDSSASSLNLPSDTDRPASQERPPFNRDDLQSS